MLRARWSAVLVERGGATRSQTPSSEEGDRDRRRPVPRWSSSSFAASTVHAALGPATCGRRSRPSSPTDLPEVRLGRGRLPILRARRGSATPAAAAGAARAWRPREPDGIGQQRPGLMRLDHVEAHAAITSRAAARPRTWPIGGPTGRSWSPQSTTTNSPPGRRSRVTSASAPGWSYRWCSTSTMTTRSAAPSGTGTVFASVSTISSLSPAPA